MVFCIYASFYIGNVDANTFAMLYKVIYSEVVRNNNAVLLAHSSLLLSNFQPLELRNY